MNEIPRRKVLQWGIGAAGMGVLAACSPPAPAPSDPAPTTTTGAPPSSTTTSTTTSTSTTTTSTTTTTTLPPLPSSNRALVVIDMAGGHDGNSLGIPFADSAYYARRPTVSVPASQVLHLNNSFGLHPNLARVYRRPLAMIEGLGHPNPDFSHSEMLRRWWFGDTDGRQFPRYGFLGRLCDVIGTANDAATGVSLGWGPSASLASQSAVTLSMDPYSDGKFPGYSDPGMNAAWIAAHQAMSQEDRAEATMFFAGRTGIRTALRFSDLLTALPASTVGYPATTLGAQLAATVRLLRAGAGIRVIHVPFGGDFDTHEDHRTRHDSLMTELDGALDAFLQELSGLGMTQNVLVATTSEFGRRAEQNSNGLDHGTATVGLLAGAVQPGVFGQHPNWATLDTNDNLKCTVTMGEYYATLAQWMGVNPGDVLVGNPAPLAGVTL
jgi:uncharacterized protein (DUF1501 family)